MAESGHLRWTFAPIPFGKKKDHENSYRCSEMGLCSFVKEERGQSPWNEYYGLGQVLSFLWVFDSSYIRDVRTQFSRFLANNEILGFGECLQPAS